MLQFRQFIYILLGVIVSASAVPTPQPLSLITVSGEHRFTVELATTPEQQETGLMFRKSLDANGGMLFVFPKAQPITMWMKNTLIPLDMVFIDEKGRVLRIEESATPKSERYITSGGPAIAVLEISGGRASNIELKPGDKVLHESLPHE